MVFLSLPPAKQNWIQISFPSTLYLYSVLDLLLHDIPSEIYSEIRLGLQEALVNAAKHGNQLDPEKLVSVRFSRTDEGYFWVISDQGKGFRHQHYTSHCQDPDLPPRRIRRRSWFMLTLHYF